MYSFCVTQQLVVFLHSFAFGILLGVSNNIIWFLSGLFILNENIRHKVSDTIFSIFLFFSSFCFILSYNLGSVRAYIVLGAFFGVFLYWVSFNETLVYILDKILNIIRKVIGILLLSPSKKMIKFLKKGQKMFKKSLKHIAKKNKNVV